MAMRFRADFIKAGVGTAIAAAGAIVCIVIIAHSDLDRRSALVTSQQKSIKAPNVNKATKLAKLGSLSMQMPTLANPQTKKAKLGDALAYLQDNEDVQRPLTQRMHALSFRQVMRANHNDVDYLGSSDPLAARSIGPDGLSDDGDAADISLLDSLSSANRHDADVMNAVDASHGVGFTYDPIGLYSQAIDGRHDMAADAAAIDAQASTELSHLKEEQGTFKMVKGPIVDKALSSKFKVLPADVNDMDESSQSKFSIVQPSGDMQIGEQLNDPFSLVHSHTQGIDLGLTPQRHSADDISAGTSDSEAEAMADPSGPPMADGSDSPGIWIEPGSNKGLDSYALDSLQVKTEA